MYTKRASPLILKASKLFTTTTKKELSNLTLLNPFTKIVSSTLFDKEPEKILLVISHQQDLSYLFHGIIMLMFLMLQYVLELLDVGQRILYLLHVLLLQQLLVLSQRIFHLIIFSLHDLLHLVV